MAGRAVSPGVVIVVCQNTATSKLVFEWIAGFQRGDAEEGERAAFVLVDRVQIQQVLVNL
jgi:hypothetical protein